MHTPHKLTEQRGRSWSMCAPLDVKMGRHILIRIHCRSMLHQETISPFYRGCNIQVRLASLCTQQSNVYHCTARLTRHQLWGCLSRVAEAMPTHHSNVATSSTPEDDSAVKPLTKRQALVHLLTGVHLGGRWKVHIGRVYLLRSWVTALDPQEEGEWRRPSARERHRSPEKPCRARPAPTCGQMSLLYAVKIVISLRGVIISDKADDCPSCSQTWLLCFHGG
jgi:hypothetical protein